jgi:hypothetical protein
MRRLLDLVLIAAILTAVGFGAYELGRRVDNTSNTLAKQDSELNQTTVSHHRNGSGPSRHTIEWVAVGIGGAVAVMIVVSFGGSLLRTRRRERWRAT